jgi:hypothetical protein
VMVFADLCGQCDKRSERVTRECTGCCQLCAIQASSHVFCHHDCSRSLLHIDGFLHVPSGYCAVPAKVCHLFYTWLFVHHWLLFCPQRAKDPVSTHDFQREIAIHSRLPWEHGSHNLCLYGAPQLYILCGLCSCPGSSFAILCAVIFSRRNCRHAICHLPYHILSPQVFWEVNKVHLVCFW